MLPFAVPRGRVLHFGPFSLNVRAGELRKHGIRIRLREQPLQILLMLLEQPGEVVLRDEIRMRLWPNDTVVEFDHGINTAIRRLRDALGESATAPQFIETVARRGYRFLGEVQGSGEEIADAAAGLREVRGVDSTASEPDDLSGKTISHYRIGGKLGAGGMGVVYRADDMKLTRPVALKFLPEALTHEPVARARFEREARAAAALTHPNICTIYAVGDFAGRPLIAMELLQGETLEKRLAQGRISKKEALFIAIQIVSALDAAHKTGIVHRDIKPANVMLTDSDPGFPHVKILDFGLAKMEAPLPSEQPESLTGQGVLLGTLRYMSPEQLQGKEADARSDLFSVGCVVYEMVAGRCPFDGPNPASVIAAVLNSEPPPVEPPSLDRVLRRCLAKDRDQRWQTARDLRAELEWIAESPSDWRGRFRTEALVWRARGRWIGAVVLTLMLAMVAAVGYREPPRQMPRMVMSMGPARDALLSPDGSAIVYTNSQGLFLRRMDALTEIPLNQLNHVSDGPVWSADGSSVVFHTIEGLMTLKLPHGPPANIWPVKDLITRGMTWGSDGTILVAGFEDNGVGRLFGVHASGNEAPFRVEIPGLKDGIFFNPEFLPNGRDFLFTWAREGADQAGIYLATLEDHKIVRGPFLLRRNATAGRFAPSAGGRLLYVLDDNLYAQKLNANSGKLEGEAQRLVDAVFSILVDRTAFFSVSRNGLLSWRPGSAALAQLTWFDRQGRVTGIAGPPCETEMISLSRDEKHVLLLLADRRNLVLDTERSAATPLDGPRNQVRWMPDSAHILHLDRRDGRLLERDVAGGPDQEVARLPNARAIRAVSPDGKTVLYKAGQRLYSVRIEGQQNAAHPALILDDALGVQVNFSPDGRWILYSIFDRNANKKEVFVQPFAFRGLRRQVSLDGGRDPVWRGDGKEILYRNGDGIYSVGVAVAGNAMRFDKPEFLFKVRVPSGIVQDSEILAVNHDGSRILFAQAVQQPDPVTYVMTAWDARLNP